MVVFLVFVCHEDWVPYFKSNHIWGWGQGKVAVGSRCLIQAFILPGFCRPVVVFVGFRALLWYQKDSTSSCNHVGMFACLVCSYCLIHLEGPPEFMFFFPLGI